MTTTSVLTLAIGFLFLTFGNGCSTLTPSAGIASNNNQLDGPPNTPEIEEPPATPSPHEKEPHTVAKTKSPHMAPPIIPGVDPKEPILPEPKTGPSPSDSVTKKNLAKPNNPEPVTNVPPKQLADLYYAPGSNIPFSGTARILYKNGKPFYEGEFKDGYRIGKGKEWHSDGQLKYDGEWRKNTPWVRHENGENVPFAGSIPSWNRSAFYEGDVFYYYSGTAEIKLKGKYLKGQLISGQNLDRNGFPY